MSRLEDAQRRLEKALARLDAATERRRNGAPVSELRRELDATRERCATLEARERELARRLDSTIGRLRAILGESTDRGRNG